MCKLETCDKRSKSEPSNACSDVTLCAYSNFL